MPFDMAIYQSSQSSKANNLNTYINVNCI